MTKTTTMRLIFTIILSIIMFTSFAQNLEFSEALVGNYKEGRFDENIKVEIASDEEGRQKNELFKVIYTKDGQGAQTLVYRDIKGSQLGEWYSTAKGQLFIRFVMKKDGSLIAEIGNDTNYDQVIDTYREFTFQGVVESSGLVVFHGKTNKEQIEGNDLGEQDRAKCDQEIATLKQYFIDNEECLVYETKGERLYVIAKRYGSHQTMKGVLIKYTDLDGSYDITHKVDIFYQPNRGEYGSAFQIFKCGEKSQLERYTVTMEDKTKAITLNGVEFKRVEP